MNYFENKICPYGCNADCDECEKIIIERKALKIIKNNDMLTDDGLILWEHDETKNSILPNEIVTKKYGKKFVSVIKKSELDLFINI